jgi:hypothetical protein
MNFKNTQNTKHQHKEHIKYDGTNEDVIIFIYFFISTNFFIFT